jgi:DNA topoisomerase-1
VAKPCPKCKFPIVSEKLTKRMGLFHKCSKKECDWMEVIDPNPSASAEAAGEGAETAAKLA